MIPPGREPLVLDMLGGGAELPASCALAGASIDRTFVSGRYTCAGREVVVLIRHPREAPGAPSFGDLALVAPPDAPQELVRAIADRVRARSKEWTWVGVVPGRPDPARTPPDMERPRRGLAFALLFAIPLAALAIRAWRARAATAPAPRAPCTSDSDERRTRRSRFP